LDHLRSGIANDTEFLISGLLPRDPGMFRIVNANRDYPGVQPVEIVFMLRDLAQFAHAVRSPVPAIENEQHRISAKRRQGQIVPVLILQGKIGRRRARDEFSLGLRQLHSLPP
jgi:hypothetical protein